LRAWATHKTPLVNPDFETQQFLDYHASRGSKMVDWTRAWYQWMRNAQQYAERRQGTAPRRAYDDQATWEGVEPERWPTEADAERFGRRAQG